MSKGIRLKIFFVPFGEWIKSTQKFAKSNKGSAKSDTEVATILSSDAPLIYFKTYLIRFDRSIIQKLYVICQ